MSDFLSLPGGILLKISQHLEFLRDVRALALTNHHLHEICNDELYERTRITAVQYERETYVTTQFVADVLSWCARFGKTECMKKFMERDLIPEPFPIWPDPITIATQFGHVDIVKLFIRYRNQSTMRALRAPGELQQLIFRMEKITLPRQRRRRNRPELAIETGQKTVMELLIQNISLFRPEMSNKYFINQLLRYAIHKGYLSGDMAKFLVGNQTEQLVLDHGSSQDDMEQTLMFAGALDSEVLKLLVDSQACLQSLPTSVFAKVMDKALRFWNARSVEMMMEKGYRLSYGPILSWTPPWDVADWSTENIFFHLSRTAGKWPDLCNVLLQHIDTGIVVGGVPSAPIIHLLYVSAAQNMTELITDILNVDFSRKYPPMNSWQFRHILSQILHSAVQYASLPTARLLVQAGADIGWIPAGHSLRTIQIAATRGSFEVFKYLLDATGGVNDSACQLLLESAIFPSQGAAIDPREKLCPVDIKHLQDRKRMVNLLLERRYPDHRQANSTRQNFFEDPSRPQINSMFLGAVSSAGGRIFSRAERLVDLNLNHRNPLHWEIFEGAIRQASLYVVKRFLEADFDAQEALLFFFSARDRNERAFGAVHEAMVENFLQQGAAINAYDPDRHTMTALASAIETLHLSVGYGSKYSIRPVEFLLRKGADPFAGPADHCALAVAVRVGHVRTVKLLMKFFEEKKTPVGEIERFVEKIGGASPRALPILYQWFRERST